MHPRPIHRRFRLCLMAFAIALAAVYLATGSAAHAARDELFWPDTPSPGHLAGETAVLDPAAAFTNLAPHLSVLHDPEGTLDITTVASPDQAERFVPLSEEWLPFDRDATVFWLRFALTAPDAAGLSPSLALAVHGSHFDAMDIFFPNQDGTGWNRHVVGHASTSFPPLTIMELQKLPPGGPHTIHVRLRTRDHAMPGIAVLDLEDRLFHVSRSAFLVGMFNGVMGAMMLLQVWLLATRRERTHFWYLGTLVFLTASFAFENDLAVGLYAVLPPPVVCVLESCAIALALVFSTLFARCFLLTRESAPALDKILVIYMWLSALLLPASLQPDLTLYDAAIHILGLLAVPVFLGGAALRLRQGFQPARTFLLGVSCYTLGAAISIIDSTDILAKNAFTENAFHVGTLFMAIILALAEVDRIRILERIAHRAEDAKRETERKLRALFDQTFQFIGLLDTDGRILDANTTALATIRATRQDILGTPFQDLPVWRQNEALHERIRRAVRDAGLGAFVRFETTHADQGSTPVYLDLSLKPVLDEDGKTVFLIAEARDITDLKTAQMQMFQADKLSALGRLVAGVAHEINNPNNFVYFNLPILREYLAAAQDMLEEHAAEYGGLTIMGVPHETYFEDLGQLLADMEHGSERITTIVKELRTYIRSHETEGKTLAHIRDAVDNALTLAGKELQRNATAIDVDVPDDMPRILMHTGRIEQVLINLLINAGHAAAGEGGHVAVHAERAGPDRVLIHVEDNGPGVPDDLADRIFEPFFTTKAGDSGTGQGLAISRTIAEEHGGALTCENLPGRGARFTLTLPVPS